MTLINLAQAHVQKTCPRIIIPEMHDSRVAEAANRLANLGCIIVEPGDPEEKMREPFRRVKPDLSEDKIDLFLQDPTHRAAALLTLGKGDFLVSGAATETATVLRAGLRAVGLEADAPLICSSFLMSFPSGKQLLFGDCAVNINPNKDQLVHIGHHLAKAAKSLFGDARMSFLSYSTGTSGSGASVDKVRAAASELKSKGIQAVGPIQGDAALNPEIGVRKGINAANPNTLIFPNIDAGNIGYKLIQELAGAQAIGPLLHGFAKPIADLSRGATTDDIVKVALISALING